MLHKYHILMAALLLGVFVPLFGQAQAQETEIRVQKSACRWLAQYQKGDADYQPGVDVSGRPVAPADLGEGRVEVPEDFVILLRIDLQDRFKLPSDSTLLDPRAILGVIEVRGDRLYFDGQALSETESAVVADACRQELSGE